MAGNAPSTGTSAPAGGWRDDIDTISARPTLSIMYVEPGQGNAPHTHEVEAFFVLKGHLDAFVEDEDGTRSAVRLGRGTASPVRP